MTTIVKKSRRRYYTLSLLLGMFYFLMHFLLRSILEISLIPNVNISFVVFDGFFVFVFYVKDTMDEINMRKKDTPFGPSWFEHAPFIGLVALHAIVIALIDEPSILITLEWIFAALLLIDIVWDLSQDIRTGPHR